MNAQFYYLVGIPTVYSNIFQSLLVSMFMNTTYPCVISREFLQLAINNASLFVMSLRILGYLVSDGLYTIYKQPSTYYSLFSTNCTRKKCMTLHITMCRYQKNASVFLLGVSPPRPLQYCQPTPLLVG